MLQICVSNMEREPQVRSSVVANILLPAVDIVQLTALRLSQELPSIYNPPPHSLPFQAESSDTVVGRDCNRYLGCSGGTSEEPDSSWNQLGALENPISQSPQTTVSVDLSSAGKQLTSNHV